MSLVPGSVTVADSDDETVQCREEAIGATAIEGEERSILGEVSMACGDRCDELASEA
jgi:hypothetical protein